MKFTLSWLKDHLETRASLDEVTEMLTRVGLEVESVSDKGKALAPFVIAHIVSAEQHPNADRLRLCRVNTGSGEPLQVVCGAANARAGLKTVFAPAGTYIPGKDFTISVGNIRGVESFGMLCSAEELDVAGDSSGIMELPEDAPVGTPYADFARLNDPVIEINLTPNRADCTGVFGIARDLAASGIGDLIHKPQKQVRGTFPCPVDVTLDLAPEDAHLAPAFNLRLIQGVRNGPSPEGMQRQLAAIGQRAINTLVDITNFITFDQGRPLHVFDAAKIKGNLRVRLAATGESFKALDGRTYTLDDTMLVICDDNGVQALAGIIGGESASCDENTTDVLLECALWDPLTIARTGRKLGIITDARYRFERGIDPQSCLWGLEIASQMILELAGGTPSERVLRGDIPDYDHIIDFPYHEVKRMTGAEIPVPEQRYILGALGCHVSNAAVTRTSVSKDGRVKVIPPSWRRDIEAKADLVEEVIRIAGLDRIPSTPLPRITADAHKAMLTPLQKRTRLAKRALATRGLMEAVTWSFISHEEAQMFGGGHRSLRLSNPIANDLSDMRPSLLPGLIKTAQRNADRGFNDVALFEVGQTFTSDEPEGQQTRITILRRGTAKAQGAGRHWAGNTNTVDFYDVKEDALALLVALGVPIGGVQIVPDGAPYLHPGRSAKIQFGPRQVVGVMGEVHPLTLKALDAKGPMVVCEIILDELPFPKYRPTKAKPRLTLHTIQPVERDFAFVVDQKIAAGDVLRAIQNTDKNLITRTTLFDVYEGAHVPEGQKSLAVSVTLQPVEKTLTDTEIDTICAKIIAEVGKKTGAALRA
jgi:phenylalanyl-tRNA synthetase beta chain